MNRHLMQSFKATMAERPVIGVFCKSEDPAVIEAMAMAGFDFLVLDREHGPIRGGALRNLMMAAELGGALPVVRTPEADWHAIGAALDLGALGVQIPQIRHPDDARAAIRHAKFHPLGERGVCRYVRAADHSLLDKSRYFEWANESLVVLQLEGREALTRVDDIIATRAADILFVGPYDLSQSLGVPGEVGHPTVVSWMEALCGRCRKAGIAIGTFVESSETLTFWMARGVRYLCYSVDIGLLAQHSRSIVERFRHTANATETAYE